jgi:hypothetical protein
MYIHLQRERRSPEQENIFSLLWDIEQLLLDDGEQQITEKRKIIPSINLQEKVIKILTTYQYSLPTRIYTATLEDEHSHTFYVTNPARESSLVFSRLRINKNDETLLQATRTKGGYHQEPIFRFLTINTITQPSGWDLDTDNIEYASKTMKEYLVDHMKMTGFLIKTPYVTWALGKNEYACKRPSQT